MRRMMPTVAVLCALTLTGAAQQPQQFGVASLTAGELEALIPLARIRVRQGGPRRDI